MSETKGNVIGKWAFALAFVVLFLLGVHAWEHSTEYNAAIAELQATVELQTVRINALREDLNYHALSIWKQDDKALHTKDDTIRIQGESTNFITGGIALPVTDLDSVEEK